MRDLKIHTNQLFTLIHSLNFTKLPTNENNKFDTAFKLEIWDVQCSHILPLYEQNLVWCDFYWVSQEKNYIIINKKLSIVCTIN